MLLEYSVDTKDENMKATAIELRRRVAGRKLNEALADGTIDADVLLELKQKNRDERKEHFNEKLTILDATVKERMSTARTNQQFGAHSQLKRLENDISRGSRLVKAKSDVLTDLEQRIRKMRAQLKHPTNPPVEVAINAELRTNDRLELDRKFGLCGCCGKSILLDVLKNHETMCFHRKHELSPPTISLEGNATGKTPKYHRPGSSGSQSAHTTPTHTTPKHTSSKRGPKGEVVLSEEERLEMEEALLTRPAVYDISSTVLTALATFPPQKPRNCEVVAKGTLLVFEKICCCRRTKYDKIYIPTLVCLILHSILQPCLAQVNCARNLRIFCILLTVLHIAHSLHTLYRRDVHRLEMGAARDRRRLGSHRL